MNTITSQEQFDNMKHVSNMVFNCPEITITNNADIPLITSWNFKKCPIVNFSDIEYMTIPHLSCKKTNFAHCNYINVKANNIESVTDCQYSTFNSCVNIDCVVNCKYCKIHCGYITNEISNCLLCNIEFTAHGKKDLIRGCVQCIIVIHNYDFMVPCSYINNCDGCKIEFDVNFMICFNPIIYNSNNTVIVTNYLMKSNELTDENSKNITIKAKHIYCKE